MGSVLVYLHMPMIFMCVCLYLYFMPISTSISVSIPLNVWMYMFLFPYLSVSLSYIHLSIHSLIHPLIHLSIHLTMCSPLSFSYLQMICETQPIWACLKSTLLKSWWENLRSPASCRLLFPICHKSLKKDMIQAFKVLELDFSNVVTIYTKTVKQKFCWFLLLLVLLLH